jgi:hypothetical protein
MLQELDIKGECKVAEFLTHLAVIRHVSLATQNQALNAIFLTKLGNNPAESQKFSQYLCMRGLYIRVITYIFKFHSSNNPYPLRCDKEARRTGLENLINRSRYYVCLAMLCVRRTLDEKLF